MAQGVDLCLILQWNPLVLASELGGERVHRGSMDATLTSDSCEIVPHQMGVEAL